MSGFTVKEMQKECRSIAKENGLTFKRMDTTYNGARLYKFTARYNGECVISNMGIELAYHMCVTGEIVDYKQEIY